MNVLGLNQDLYLAGNPIWIDVQDIQTGVKYIEITVSNVTDPLAPINSRPVRVYYAGNSVRYNLQEIIKGNFPAPKYPDLLIEDADIKTNYARFAISIKEIILYTPTGTRPRGREERVLEYTKVGEVVTYTKTFIRGWEKSMLTNITLSIGDLLADAERIPRWGGYPSARFYIATDKRIRGSQFIPKYLADDRKVVGCDPLYVRYLNSRGGYSYWLFESYEEKTVNKSTAYTQNFGGYEHTGVNSDITIQAETRVPAMYFKSIQALLRSPEVHIYRKYGVEWAKVILKDSSPVENNYDTAMKVAATFEVLTQETANVTW